MKHAIIVLRAELRVLEDSRRAILRAGPKGEIAPTDPILGQMLKEMKELRAALAVIRAIQAEQMAKEAA